MARDEVRDHQTRQRPPCPRRRDRGLDESLHRFGFDHVDLFLIHWPRPHEGSYVETWKAVEKVAADGKARAIGVSNFTVEHLDRIAGETDNVPAVNQVELHARFAQARLDRHHAEHGIVTEAWSPIGQSGDLLEDERLVEPARRHGPSSPAVPRPPCCSGQRC